MEKTPKAIDLSALIDDAQAPFEIIEKHGRGRSGSRFLCPVCSSVDVRIYHDDPEGGEVLVGRPDGIVAVGFEGRGRRMPNAQKSSSVLSVAVPMTCPQGHDFLLWIGGFEGEPVKMAAILSDACWPVLYPELREESEATQ
jgi:hypothetical protein